MSQPVTTTDQLTATQYVVPVQALQGLPQLAKAANSPAAPQASATGRNWSGILAVSVIWGAVIWLGVDMAYGGFDKRQVQAELATAKQQAAELQQQNAALQQQQLQQQDAITNAAAALGCITNGGPVQ
jgi:uncharacterized protein HemX